MSKLWTRRPISPSVVLAFGVFAVSTAAILIKFAQAEAPSLVIAAWRLTFASVLLLPWAWRRQRDELRALPRAGWVAALGSGFFLALHFATWISSLAYTSVATSAVLVATLPLWVALASPFVLRERVARPVQLGIGLALLGSVIVAVGNWLQPDGLVEILVDNRPVLGASLALGGAVTGAGYLIIGRRLRATLSLLSYITIVYSSAAVCLVVLALLAGQPLFGYSPATYGLILLMAVFPQLLGHSAYNWALGFLPAAFVTIAVISEPLASTVLALLVFGEAPGPWTLIGSVFILVALVIASRAEVGATPANADT